MAAIVINNSHDLGWFIYSTPTNGYDLGMFYMFYGFYMFLQPQSEKGLKDPLRPFTGPCHSEAELRSRFLSAIVDGACGPNRGGFGGRFWFIVRWIFGFLIGGVKLIIGDNLEHSGTDFQ